MIESKSLLQRALPSQTIVAALAAGTLLAQAADNSASTVPLGGLADLSVEQLMNESVTSVAKRETKFNESAAAISVITQDDIRRQGITTLPDALRLVPGLDVAQINSHEWAISARGFNNEFANKLLVLIDGRSIYGTGFGGVAWGVPDVAMEDIERIEVIRGPGATLWGANAVNGVINIITKSAKDTQGTLVSASGGSLEQPVTTIRFGGQAATNLYYRVYGKISNRDGLETGTSQDAPDRTLNLQGGLRLDWEPSDEDRFTLQGDFYWDRFVENQDMPGLSPPYLQNFNQINHNHGGNALGRWTHDFSDTSALTVQMYYDHFHQEQAGASETTSTADFDVQHRFALGTRNDITWGFGFRDTMDRFTPSPFLSVNPSSDDDELSSAFVQDEITLAPDCLKLTLGSKFENNDDTDCEFEPSGKLLWKPTGKQSLWLAVSRAVRTPSRIELDSRANEAVIPPMPPTSPLPVLVSTIGNNHLNSENLTAYELGYRIQLSRRLSLDATTFYDDYDNLIDQVSAAPRLETSPLPPHALAARLYENTGSGHTYGAEISAHWDVTDHWHLSANYSWLDSHLDFDSTYLDASPKQQAQLSSALDLPGRFELNGVVSFVDRIDAYNSLGKVGIPSYVRLDIGLIWHATKNLELGVWGQNLAEDRHAEFTSYKTSLITEIPRSVVGRVTLHF